MKLDYICETIAKRTLTPGTIVECMKDFNNNILEKGILYKVAFCHLSDRIMLKGYPNTVFPTRFRKAIL